MLMITRFDIHERELTDDPRLDMERSKSFNLDFRFDDGEGSSDVYESFWATMAEFIEQGVHNESELHVGLHQYIIFHRPSYETLTLIETFARGLSRVSDEDKTVVEQALLILRKAITHVDKI